MHILQELVYFVVIIYLCLGTTMERDTPWEVRNEQQPLAKTSYILVMEHIQFKEIFNILVKENKQIRTSTAIITMIKQKMRSSRVKTIQPLILGIHFLRL